MQENNLIDIDAMMDEKFGAIGSPERSEFREKAHAYNADTNHVE